MELQGRKSSLGMGRDTEAVVRSREWVHTSVRSSHFSVTQQGHLLGEGGQEFQRE